MPVSLLKNFDFTANKAKQYLHSKMVLVVS